MKKFYKKHTILIHIILLIISIILEIFLITDNKYILGSTADWLKQDVAFADYFRNLFYQTHNLFPNLAIHIGSGQNIYYFSYYGLFSPLILLSYLFPFIKMVDYIMIVSILNIMLTVILFYFFLIKNNYSKEQSLIGALLFSSSSSFIFNSQQEIMFVSYMSFLILALMGVKKFKEKNNSLLLISSVTLIILTSYYFSIPCILCLYLYNLYLVIKQDKNHNFKAIINSLSKLTPRIIISILFSMFLLLPTFYAIKNGRTTSNILLSIKYFIPKMTSDTLAFSHYGIGLSTIVLIALIFNILYGKKENKILSILITILFLFPIFNFLLNGMLYTNEKVFIPFIPLILILIIEIFEKILNIDYKKFIFLIITTMIFSILFIEFDVNYLSFLKNMIFNFFFLFLFYKRKKTIYIVPILLISFILTINYCHNDKQITLETYNQYKYFISSDISEYINHDTTSIYRYQTETNSEYINTTNADNIYLPTSYSSTSNTAYNNIFYNSFSNNHRHTNIFVNYSNNNPFLLKFMGVKYIFTNNPAYGYKKVKEYDNGTLYESDYTYSIGYASSNLLNIDEYNELSFIEKLEAYQNNIIIDGKSNNSNLDFNYDKVNKNFEIIDSENISIQEKNGHYLINSDSNAKLTLSLDESLKNKTLIIKFNVNNNPACDKAKFNITINNVKNILPCIDYTYYNNNTTFHYVINSNEEIKNLNISFSKGIYDISDIEIYSIDNSFFEINNTTPINIDFDKTIGDNIEGNITLDNDGYFIFTIPYDDGYKLLVDGKETEIKIINNGFIGFPLEKGTHNIKLSFEAPYSSLGKALSCMGIIGFGILIAVEKKKFNKS
jgi:uncharacterized membrane protein YfhO